MSELSNNAKKEEESSQTDFAALLDNYQFKANELTLGQLIKGKVIKVTPSFVLVDVGSKSEGIIPLEDFIDKEELNKLNPGDEVEAVLEKSNLEEGYFILSKKRANALKALNNLEKAHLHNNWIIGKITQKVKNGYMVNVGINTFLPDSHADIRIVKDPSRIIGNRYKFKVIKFNRNNENAVLSRKLLLQDEKEKRKKQVFSQLETGKTFKGKIKSLTNFGAFVDLGGVEGLLHISEISWGNINHPSEIFQQGQEIDVVILDYDEKEEKISLSFKQLSKDPWENVEGNYQEGQIINGKVVSLTDFGAFVELEPGVEGLVHISDMSWARKLVHPKNIVSIGEEISVTILNIEPETKRISLGLKQSTPHPLKAFQKKYSQGSRIKGKISNVTDFGAFLEVEKGVEGLIHISDLSWKKIKHPSQIVKAGEEVETIILSIDTEKQKLSLGIKQLEGDIWEDFFKRQKIGDLVNVKIVRIVNFGIFVEITPGIEGVVFLSELDEKRIDDPADDFSVGEERMAKIIKLSQKDKKISLSFRQAQQEMQKKEYEKFMNSQDDRMTLGDIMKDQLKGLASLNNKKNKKEKKEKKDDKS
jgi:small subunit ribosomal protein S1